MTTNAPQTLDLLLIQHGNSHLDGSCTKEQCKTQLAAIDAEILRLCPSLTANDLLTLAWLAKGGAQALSDTFVTMSQLFYVAAFHPAGDVAEEILKVFTKAQADAEYVNRQLAAAGVERHDLLDFLNIQKPEDWISFVDMHTLSNSKLVPGGEMSDRVKEVETETNGIIETNGIVHDDGAYTAYTLIIMGSYIDDLLKASQLIGVSIKYITSTTWAQACLDFITATYTAADEGAALQAKYKDVPYMFELRHDELGMQARRFTLEPIEYAAKHGNLEGYDTSAMAAFVKEQQAKESPVAQFLRQAGMPEEIIRIFA